MAGSHLDDVLVALEQLHHPCVLVEECAMRWLDTREMSFLVRTSDAPFPCFAHPYHGQHYCLACHPVSVQGSTTG